ncbi:hypothetical protein EJ08DRAFT_699722 [Tothia fuscella]|uniref:Uncharacterized protein n=1 Tax=Tothia fuscella TaxID=1048955 RepID=A0A9P4TWM5_9PEZI|nr:hypothetical protein EJ08DRAFT_699722 [Tothia fuscella]
MRLKSILKKAAATSPTPEQIVSSTITYPHDFRIAYPATIDDMDEPLSPVSANCYKFIQNLKSRAIQAYNDRAASATISETKVTKLRWTENVVAETRIYYIDEGNTITRRIEIDPSLPSEITHRRIPCERTHLRMALVRKFCQPESTTTSTVKIQLASLTIYSRPAASVPASKHTEPAPVPVTKISALPTLANPYKPRKSTQPALVARVSALPTLATPNIARKRSLPTQPCQPEVPCIAQAPKVSCLLQAPRRRGPVNSAARK